ncbi:MAG: CBS domain-containing protein [Actinomycetota bacterium]|nr:CBS domain-containing protein [Actinomycetota bacterium]
MTKDVVTLSSDSTVTDAAQVMVRGGFGSVVVVHGRMLLGILTERDVLRAAASEDDLRSALVERWMTPDPDTSEPDLDTEEAAGLMLSRGYRHLPVVVDGDLVGMVSLRDVLSARIARSRGVDLGGP